MSEKARPVGCGHVGHNRFKEGKELLVIEPPALRAGMVVKLKVLPNLVKSTLGPLVGVKGIVKAIWETPLDKQCEVKYHFNDLTTELLFMVGTRVILPERWLDVIPIKEESAY